MKTKAHRRRSQRRYPDVVPPRASLLGLPAELRDIILSIVLAESHKITITQRGSSASGSRDLLAEYDRPRVIQEPAVLRVNRLLREEGLWVYYKTNAFNIELCIENLPQAKHSAITFALRQQMDDVTIAVLDQPSWPAMLAVLRDFWAGQFAGLGDAKWISYAVILDLGGWDAARGFVKKTTRKYEDILEGAVGIVKARLSWPWARVEQALWDHITDEGLARIVRLGPQPSAQRGGWIGGRKLALLESETECP